MWNAIKQFIINDIKGRWEHIVWMLKRWRTCWLPMVILVFVCCYFMEYFPAYKSVFEFVLVGAVIVLSVIHGVWAWKLGIGDIRRKNLAEIAAEQCILRGEPSSHEGCQKR